MCGCVGVQGSDQEVRTVIVIRVNEVLYSGYVCQCATAIQAVLRQNTQDEFGLISPDEIHASLS